MKQEIFDKAQEIQAKLNDLADNIRIVEKNEKCGSGRPINIHFMYDEETEALRESVLKYMKEKQTKLKREFENLK